MRLIFSIFLLLLSLFTSVAYAEKITNAEVKELARNATTGLETGNYLSKDGKVRYIAYYEMTPDGNVELKAKKQYLPAVTDGKIIDKTASFRTQLAAKKLGGYIFKGGNALMMASLVVDILGEGVDYVLDPANNSVIVNRGPSNASNANLDNYCQDVFGKIYPNAEYINYSHHDASNANLFCNVKIPGFELWKLIIAAPESSEKEQEVMTAEELGQAIKELAKAGNEVAQQVIIDTVKDEVVNGEHDTELQRIADELNADDPETDPTTDPNAPTQTDDQTQTEDSNLNLPPFCEWAGVVCDFVNWYKTEPNLNDEVVPEKDIPLKDPSEFDKEYIKTSAQCPADIVVPVDMGFAKHTITFEMSPICNFASMYLKPVLMFLSYLSAVMIIAGSFKVG